MKMMTMLPIETDGSITELFQNGKTGSIIDMGVRPWSHCFSSKDAVFIVRSGKEIIRVLDDGAEQSLGSFDWGVVAASKSKLIFENHEGLWLVSMNGEIFRLPWTLPKRYNYRSWQCGPNGTIITSEMRTISEHVPLGPSGELAEMVICENLHDDFVANPFGIIARFANEFFSVSTGGEIVQLGKHNWYSWNTVTQGLVVQNVDREFFLRRYENDELEFIGRKKCDFWIACPYGIIMVTDNHFEILVIK